MYGQRHWHVLLKRVLPARHQSVQHQWERLTILTSSPVTDTKGRLQR